MKASFFAIAALWVGVALAQAPDTMDEGPHGGGPGGHRESPEQHLDHLTTLLDLTDAQKTQVGAILESEHATMKAQRDQSQASGQRPTFEQMKAAHDQMQQDTITKLTPVLTAAQLEKFKVLMSERGPAGGGGPR
jgi:Spy/CpxP family protein refolding chaperone